MVPISGTGVNAPRQDSKIEIIVLYGWTRKAWKPNVKAMRNESELDSMTIPCISMIGALPIFYLVPVTRELSDAVATFQYPLSSTVVQKCVVTSNNLRLSEGMETPDFRQVSLQHYAAFRTLAETHWSTSMIPVEMETSGPESL